MYEDNSPTAALRTLIGESNAWLLNRTPLHEDLIADLIRL